MVKCDKCGVDELLPFKCAYCGGNFCPEHRLPELHGCGGIMLAKRPVEKRPTVEGYIQPWVPRVRKRLFTRAEILHLLTASGLIALAGLSIFFTSSTTSLAISVAGLTLSFLAHEMAHKFWSMRTGLSARFRIYPLGAALTAVTAIPFIPIKFIAPGAVHVAGPASGRDMGMIALAGPVANILIALGLYTSYWVGVSGFLGFRLAELNVYLALFNLIPFGPLDGGKVIKWSWLVWAICFAASLLLLIVPRLV
jgi:Zn-dependent protease